MKDCASLLTDKLHFTPFPTEPLTFLSLGRHQTDIACSHSSILIEIIDIECVLGNLAGTQIEKKIALINPPCWICPRSGLCELQWGEFNLPL